MISKISAFIGCSGLLILLLPFSVNASATSPSILISELQTRPSISSSQHTNERFIELYNFGDTPVDISGWKLEYKPASGGSWSNRFASSQSSPQYVIAPGAFYIVATTDFIAANPSTTSVDLLLNNSALTSDAGGHIRLVTSENVLVDQVGWGSADSALQEPALAPSYGRSLQRCVQDGLVTMTGNNARDFLVYTELTPRLLLECSMPTEPDDEPIPDGGMGAGLTCEGIMVSEILPNPAGADAGNEFIELHNPTDEVISLNGCALQTSAHAKTYNFGAVEMQPGEYVAFYDSVTGLTLPNAAGGTVWLLSPAEELQAVTYAGGLADDVSWIWFASAWQPSYKLTPNAPNELLSEKPCPAGQERNPETNACRTIVTAASANLTPCRDGQERNPATNRCRAIASTASTLTPCREGQERNPATNRCRSIQGDNELAPCAEGQERNPETNRCRRIAAVAGSSMPEVKDVYAGSLGSSPRWLLIGLLAVSAIGYALFEWRHEFLGRFKKSRA